MMRRVAVFTLALFLIAPAASAAPENNERQSYIVVLKSSAGDPGAVASEHSRNHGSQVRYVYRHALRGYAAVMSETAAARVANDRRVDYVEADGEVHAIATQTNATWGLDRIDQRDLPLNEAYTYNATGSGVKAFIIDTGIRYSHIDFGGRATFGYDSFGGDGSDCNGHGTHVAGTVGGATWGVAKSVGLVAVRVLNCSGSGTWSGVIAGMDWVTAQKKATPSVPMVANMSLGGGANSSVDNALAESTKVGVSYSVAAGNGNNGGVAQDACNYSPARAPSALTVGATTSSDSKTSWSNYGTCLDLFAPGASITSAWYNSDTATKTISGTSMAAPHVAGVAALYLQGNTSASAAAVADAVTSTATPNKVSNAGPGSPNLLAYSLLTTDGGSTDPNSAPVVSITTPADNSSFDAGTSITFEGSATDVEDGNLTTSLAWSSSLDGAIGSGGSFSTSTLSTGEHVITASVSDSDGAPGSASINVTINSTSEPPPATSLAVSIAQGSKWTSGPWHRTNLIVTVTDGSAGVSGATVTLNVSGDGSCGQVVSSGSGTTGADGTVTFEFRNRGSGDFSAKASASYNGSSAESACLPFSV